MALQIKYNGKTIATLEKGQTATIPCKGKKMLTELVVDTIAGLPGGLYDERYNLLASWRTLTTQYGLDVSKNHLAYLPGLQVEGLLDSILQNSELSSGKHLVIPTSVTSIGKYALGGCANLTSITIPNSLKSIGDFAFAECLGATDITIPDGATTIGDHSFSGCDNLSSVTIPNSVTSIGGSAFSGCGNLMYIAIPDSVKTIGSAAFYECTFLMNVTLLGSITNIDERMFYGCTGLTEITIPASVKSIGNEAFANCTSLTDIYYEGTAERWRAISVGSGNEVLSRATIHYGGESGGETGSLISFTIDGTAYQAEDGMTWEQWVESSYNTDGYRLRIGHFVASSNGWYVIDEEGTLEFPTDTISNGVDYALQDPSN